MKDVRGIQLSNAMKNMDIGELRPRQVNDDEDDQVQVLSNSNVQVIQIKLVQVALMTMNKIKWLVHHLNQIIKQVQEIKFQSSNQSILQEIIHWTLSLVISQEVYKLDQDWHLFVSTSHLCHPLNLRR